LGVAFPTPPPPTKQPAACQDQTGQASTDDGPGDPCYGNARNLACSIPRTAIDDLKEIRGPEVDKRRQRDRRKSGTEVKVTSELDKSSRTRPVCVNQELEERRRCIAVPGDGDLERTTGRRP